MTLTESRLAPKLLLLFHKWISVEGDLDYGTLPAYLLERFILFTCIDFILFTHTYYYISNLYNILAMNTVVVQSLKFF